MTSLSRHPGPTQAALERLRLRVEGETAGRTTTRRPSWSRTITVDGELLQICDDALGLFEAADRFNKVVRLWACFTAGEHAVHGFELCIGKTHGKAAGQLWQATRTESGWRCSSEVLTHYMVDKQLRYQETHGPAIIWNDDLHEAVATHCLQVQARELAAALVADYIEFLEIEQPPA